MRLILLMDLMGMIGYSIFVLLAIAFVANILGDGLVLQLSL